MILVSEGHFLGGLGQARRRPEGAIRLIGLIGPIRLIERHGVSTGAITHCNDGTAQRRLTRIA